MTKTKKEQIIKKHFRCALKFSAIQLPVELRRLSTSKLMTYRQKKNKQIILLLLRCTDALIYFMMKEV